MCYGISINYAQYLTKPIQKERPQLNDRMFLHRHKRKINILVSVSYWNTSYHGTSIDNKYAHVFIIYGTSNMNKLHIRCCMHSNVNKAKLLLLNMHFT